MKLWGFAVVVVVGFAVGAGCTASYGGACIEGGQPCGRNTASCCSGTVCVKGVCQKRSCGAAGASCVLAGDCCDGVCTSGTCGKKFGDACLASSECVTKTCLSVMGFPGSFCSAACTSNDDCSAYQAPCIPGKTLSYCRLPCQSSTDCAKIGWSCNHVLDASKTPTTVCGVWSGAPEGAPCLDNAQCANGTCGGAWCSTSCTSDVTCGNVAWCILDSSSAYSCFPSCSGAADCAIYGAGATCISVTSRGGSKVSVCSF